MKTFIISFFSLAIIWFVLSGYLKTNLLLLGVFSCVLVTIISIKMRVYLSNNERLDFVLRMPFYLPWLFKEIILSNFYLAKKVLSSNPNSIQPQSINIKPSQKTNTGIALHANSITLTPGTISIKYDEEGLLVHALTDHTAQGIIDGDIDKKVSKIERGIN
ncbi:MAG: Na+/H+ antiporter subunit E [Pseudomonadota bacterium]